MQRAARGLAALTLLACLGSAAADGACEEDAAPAGDVDEAELSEAAAMSVQMVQTSLQLTRVSAAAPKSARPPEGAARPEPAEEQDALKQTALPGGSAGRGAAALEPARLREGAAQPAPDENQDALRQTALPGGLAGRGAAALEPARLREGAAQPEPAEEQDALNQSALPCGKGAAALEPAGMREGAAQPEPAEKQDALNQTALPSGFARGRAKHPQPTPFFKLYKRFAKYFLFFFLVTALCVMTCLTAHYKEEGFAFDTEEEKTKSTSCGGLCPCRVHPEPRPSDLENWEESGQVLFGQCPAWMNLPKDLGPRQWTWRIAEINLWIQIFVSANLVYESWNAPRAVMTNLQLSLSLTMFVSGILAVSWVHVRSRKTLIHYTFFTLVTKAFYIAAKYSMLSGFATACALAQTSFVNCMPVGPLASCLKQNNCLQDALDLTICRAPGVDTCKSLATYMPAGGDLFVADLLELSLFLLGTVPVFMAATAHESIMDPANPISPTPRLN